MSLRSDKRKRKSCRMQAPILPQVSEEQAKRLAHQVVPHVLAPGQYTIAVSTGKGGQCRIPLEGEPGYLELPVASEPYALAVKAHEYAHLRLGLIEPNIDLGLRVESKQIPMLVAQALADWTANTLCRDAGVNEVFDLPFPETKEALEAVGQLSKLSRATWYIRALSIERQGKGKRETVKLNKAVHKTMKHCGLPETLQTEIKACLKDFDASNKTSIEAWQKASDTLIKICSEKEREGSETPNEKPKKKGPQGKTAAGQKDPSGEHEEESSEEESFDKETRTIQKTKHQETKQDLSRQTKNEEELLQQIERAIEKGKRKHTAQQRSSVVERPTEALKAPVTDTATQEVVHGTVLESIEQQTVTAMDGSLGTWGEAKIIRPAKRYMGSIEHSGLNKVPSFVGALAYPTRATCAGDGRAFALLGRHKGGTVLIDVSGSMDLGSEDIEAFLKERPAMTIAMYSARGSRGYLVILAEKGKVVKDLQTVCEHFRRMGNIIDGPALRWLAKQRRPRIWICDGIVTGLNDIATKATFENAAKLRKLFGILRYCSIEAFHKEVVSKKDPMIRHDAAAFLEADRREVAEARGRLRK